jgi:CubicO group peptidase (beta-lactamase class C family)
MARLLLYSIDLHVTPFARLFRLMLTRAIVIVVLLLCIALPVSAEGPSSLATDLVLEVDLLMQRAMEERTIAGGVILVGNRQGVLLERAFGRVSPLPDAVPVAMDTVFDLASLTKVVATTPAVMKLAEQGRLSLVDPLVKWFPEFAGRGKDEVLVVHLLTHTSGLDDVILSPESPLQSALERAAAEQLKGEPGVRFKYADINFILLGELVRRVTGVPLDRYAAEVLYRPLGMAETGFTPDQETANRCAATLDGAGLPVLGVVQDYPARLLGGVAGHAGLFSTARDLSRFCQAILNNGTLQGRHVMAVRTVEQMTAPYFSRGGKVARGLGWDIASPYSSPRGKGFAEGSFGHTGYSGTSVWVDPRNDIYVVFLSVRLNYRDVKSLARLRAGLSSLVAAMFISRQTEEGPEPGMETASLPLPARVNP